MYHRWVIIAAKEEKENVEAGLGPHFEKKKVE